MARTREPVKQKTQVNGREARRARNRISFMLGLVIGLLIALAIGGAVLYTLLHGSGVS
ncbi:MAG: hypothetical protein IJ074_06225 [Clostridia bacterium]|nr:hypothetical protein [Clostridia bacterium]